MALSMDVVFSGLSIPKAYIKVARIEILSKTTMHAVFATQVDAASDPLFYQGYETAYDLQGADPMKQAYDYVKTLPAFAGAVDVLEDGQTA